MKKLVLAVFSLMIFNGISMTVAERDSQSDINIKNFSDLDSAQIPRHNYANEFVRFVTRLYETSVDMSSQECKDRFLELFGQVKRNYSSFSSAFDASDMPDINEKLLFGYIHVDVMVCYHLLWVYCCTGEKAYKELSESVSNWRSFDQ